MAADTKQENYCISYNPLWKTLIDRRMTRGQLCEAVHLSRATVTKMGKSKPIALTIIGRICAVLDIPVQAVLEIKKTS